MKIKSDKQRNSYIDLSTEKNSECVYCFLVNCPFSWMDTIIFFVLLVVVSLHFFHVFSAKID